MYMFENKPMGTLMIFDDISTYSVLDFSLKKLELTIKGDES